LEKQADYWAHVIKLEREKEECAKCECETVQWKEEKKKNSLGSNGNN
jgi:hypothetical protein